MKKLGKDLLEAMEVRTYVTVVVTLADNKDDDEVDLLSEIFQVLFEVDIAGLSVSETSEPREVLLIGIPVIDISRLAARKEIKGIRLG